jgi:predicted ATP-dependent serine protease
VSRKTYRANWVRRDYARRRKQGICTRCPAKAQEGEAKCGECSKWDRLLRSVYRRSA